MSWDASKPASAEAKNLAPAQIQGNWAVIEDWLNDIGNFPTVAAVMKGSAASLAFISAQTAAASATIDFTSGFSSTYDHYVFRLSNVQPVTNTVDLWMRVSQSAVFLNGGSDYGHARFGSDSNAATTAAGSGTDSKIVLISQGTAAGTASMGEIILTTPTSAINKLCFWNCHIYTDGKTGRVSGAGAFQLNTTAIDGVRFMMSSGNISAGTFALYGVRKV